VALWNFLARRYTVAVAASTGAVGITLVTVAAYLSGTSLPAEGMSLASSVLWMTIALAVLLASARRRLLREEAAIGIAGFVLLAFTATFLIARASSLIDPMTDNLVAALSLQTFVGSVALGVCFVVLIWSRGLLAGETARWLPAALGAAGVITVLVLWRALATREIDQLHSLTRQAADERRRVLVREAAVGARALRRAAEWRAGGATLPQARRDFDALRRDLPGLEAAGWLSPAGRLDTTGTAELRVLGADSALFAYIGREGRLPDSIAFLPLDEGGRRFLTVSPACDAAKCAGAMVAIFGTADFFRASLPDTSRGFGFGITGRSGLIGGSPVMSAPDPRWTQWLALSLGATDLTLTAWPSASTIGRVRSMLPGLVLFLGLAVSTLVGVSALLAQRTVHVARDAERARLQTALERSTDGIWEWEIPTGHSLHSARVWHHLGYDPAVVPSTRAAWLALIHPEDLPRVLGEIEAYLKGDRPAFESEYRVLAKDGSWHTMADRGSIVDRAPSGAPVHMVGIKADVTESRTAQAAREAAERRYRGIFDSGFQYQLLLDREARVVEVNPHALEASGTERRAVVGRHLSDVLWWAGNAPAQERLKNEIAAVHTGEMRRYEEAFPGKDSTALNLEIAIKPVVGIESEAQLLVEARDLTAFRRAEAAVREVESLTTMGRIAARVAHEINNPLAGIQNSFLLVKDAIPEEHPHYKYVGAIEREIARIAVVTRQLYETYRPEQDSTATTSVATVIGDAVAFLEQVNRQSEVRVVVELSHRPSVLMLPSVMMRQMVYNLVQNAIEASPKGATVHVRTLVQDGKFVLRVRDNGPGIPCDVREKVFEPFFTTKSGRIRTGGMGLGLSLVRRTINAFGGTIEFADVEGGGCEFTVTLPLNPPDRVLAS
jgi:PAS domain S-box-containing protein